MELVVKDINHAYGAAPVLADIDFTVRDGETIAVIGPSGCGKSTLLGILGGLIRPDHGEVFVRGAMPADCLNPITYVFQDFALLPWMSVAQNVGLVLDHHRLSSRDKAERVTDVLARTGLSDFAGAFPKQLSGGMRQRCGIARALAVRPAVLLMDEPLSALDAQTRDLLMADFLTLWARSKTTAVYVTHNLDEALRLADRIIVLSRRPGRMKEIVAVTMPREERTTLSGLAELERLRLQLWDLIRLEAEVADREVVHV
jgi:NitT/TauT family transport system ATP-binding protein